MKSKFTFLTVAWLCVSVLVFAGVAIADDDNGFNCDVTVSPGDVIQDTIDASDAGDTICVEPGTYTEDLSITKSLQLVGLFDDDSRPTIEGVATVPAGDFPLAIPNIDIQANDVVIYGFNIQSPIVAADQYSSGIVLAGKNIEICKNHFFVGTGDVSQAIQTYRQTNAPEGLRDISGLYICKNTFTHLAPATGLGAYEAIFVNPQSDEFDPELPTNAVVISKNRFAGNLIRAITTQRSGTVIVKNRMLTDWTAPEGLSTFPRGIQLSKASDADSTDHMVTKNKVFDRGAALFSVGILLGDSVSMSRLEKNNVKSAATNGIDVHGGSNDLVKNNVRYSGETGIHLGTESETNILIKNKVRKSGVLDINDEGTNNEFFKNKCKTSDPSGLCK